MHSTRTRAVLRLAAIARTTFGDAGSGSSAGTRPKEPVRTPMKGKRVRRLVIIPAATVLLVAGASAAARAEPPPGRVDVSRLVPSLSASFAPWTCKAVQTGPVCNGERRIDTGWGPFDFSCGDTPVYARHEEVRRATRYYGWDYLNYDRRVRTNDIDYLGTSPGGPATATISTTVRFVEPFAVPGDDSTFTVITDGVIWDIRSAQGAALFRAVGTLVEPPGEVGTFTGHVTEHGITTRYTNAPLTEVLSKDAFVELVCEAVTDGH